jgi:hypothetical protein
MRLLERKPDGELVLSEFTGKDVPVPAYAILSHTWATDNSEEVSFQDVEAGTGKSKTGYNKIRFCAEQAAADGLRYFWVDTCWAKSIEHKQPHLQVLDRCGEVLLILRHNITLNV